VELHIAATMCSCKLCEVQMLIAGMACAGASPFFT
jgi:hypothetical protein